MGVEGVGVAVECISVGSTGKGISVGSSLNRDWAVWAVMVSVLACACAVGVPAQDAGVGEESVQAKPENKHKMIRQTLPCFIYCSILICGSIF